MREIENPTAFPVIEDERFLAAIQERAGEPESFAEGDRLWAPGDEDVCFFVVKEGEISVSEGPCGADGEPVVIAEHRAGQFTGDIDVLAGRPSATSASAKTPLKAWRLSNEELRELVRMDQDLGAMLMEAMLARREILEREGDHGVRVVGSRFDPETHRIREFLSRNRVLHHWLRPEDDHVRDVFRAFERAVTDLPLVIIPGRERALVKPSLEDLAREVGVLKPMDGRHFDLAIVGAGPAGLAAAVYGGSEGLSTLVIEAVAPGGQASWSARIENYMGFPEGLSGTQLADAGRRQAEKFGATLSSPARVEEIECGHRFHTLKIRVGDEDPEIVTAGCVVLAAGAQYRRLDAQGFERFEGRGIYYAATETETEMCRDYEVAVVGGANSAGQAVVHLAGSSRKVRLIVRGPDILSTMSDYLAARVMALENVEVITNAEVVRIDGDETMESVTLSNGQSFPCASLFCFIGAQPNTDLVKNIVALNEEGYVLTGAEIPKSMWPRKDRPPYYLETSCPGLLAAGDCRIGSVKRVASAVGEGAMAVTFAHRILSE